jgi:hypothetical protein
VIQNWLNKDRFKLNQRDDDYQRYLEVRTSLLSERIQTNDDKELVKYALSLSSEEREKLAREAIQRLMEEESK